MGPTWIAFPLSSQKTKHENRKKKTLFASVDPGSNFWKSSHKQLQRRESYSPVELGLGFVTIVRSVSRSWSMSECRSVPIPVHADAVVSLLVWSKACSWSKRRSVGAKPKLIGVSGFALELYTFLFVLWVCSHLLRV
jgi:hypothetical protein